MGFIAIAIDFLLGLIAAVLNRLLATPIVAWVQRRLRRNRRDKLPNQNTKIARVLILQSGRATYGVEIASWVRTGATRRLREIGRDVFFSSSTVPVSKHPSKTTLRSLRKLSKGQDIVLTIGLAATTAYANLRSQHPHDMPAQAFVAITTQQAQELFGTFDRDVLRGNVSGVSFGLTPLDRLKFLQRYFQVSRVLFVSGHGIETDTQQARAFREASKILTEPCQLDVVEAKSPSDAISALEKRHYDFALGWYFLHENMSDIAGATTTPVLGAGAVDARSGATVSIAEPEDELAREILDRILIPYITEGAQLSRIPIATLREVVPRYRPAEFLNSSAIHRTGVKVPRTLQSRASIFH